MPKTEGLTLDSPTYQTIKRIVWSPEGQQAALEAVKCGHPALGGVDPLLQKELGKDYGREDLGTASAGSEVAMMMRERGYTEAGRGSCPHGCVARSGLTWKPKQQATSR